MNEQELRELTLSVVDRVGLDASEIDFRSLPKSLGVASDW